MGSSAFIFILGASVTLLIQNAGKVDPTPVPDSLRHDSVSITVSRDFDWMVTKVTTNYPGYDDKIHDKQSFNLFTDSLRRLAIQMNTLENAVPLFESWLRAFKDAHLEIRLKKSAPSGRSGFDSLRVKFQGGALNKTTALLILPSFNIRYKHAIDSILQANEQTIRNAPNLIIDIRNNGGGSDESFSGLLPFLYTNPIVRINSDIWSTEDNVGKYESVAADTHYTAETRQVMKVLAGKLRLNVGRFVSEGDDDTLQLPAVDPVPTKVIILMNNYVASSAEGFLLQAVQSKKVVLAGEHSKGELDYASVHYMTSPGGRLILGCPTSRSRRLPHSPIDNIGVEPDVLLTPGKDWIRYIAARVDDFEFSPVRFSHGSIPQTRAHLPSDGTKDTSLVDLRALANSIVPADCKEIVDRVRYVIDWTNTNFEWTFTDYKNRTVKEIVARGGGNCSEQTRVARALLRELGIKTRSTCEINIQPDDTARQARAEEKVKQVGNKMSVFGLNHNDHVWIEFFDEADQQWKPADPTLELVGIESWLMARVGFAPRPTHAIIPSRDMLVPIAIFARDDRTGAITEDRTEYYLINQFNVAYGGRLAATKEWGEWTRSIREISNKCRGAFEGTSNLHASTQMIRQIGMLYKELRDAEESAP